MNDKTTIHRAEDAHRDHVMPQNPWRFDDGVTQVFDEMLQRSIPQYDVMRKTVTALAAQHVKRETDVVDLGSSRGEAVAELVHEFGAHNRYLLVECAPPMVGVLSERFEGLIKSNVVRVLERDFARDFPVVTKASVVLSVFAIQFTPIEYRQGIFQNIYNALLPGGAFIMCEKVIGANAAIDKMMVANYLDFKRENGYSEDEIQRKRLSLEGVLVPVTAGWNEELLKQAGFKTVDCFWRWMNFAGWIAVK